MMQRAFPGKTAGVSGDKAFRYDPSAPGPELEERANEALRIWVGRLARRRGIREEIPIGERGPRMQVLRSLLAQRDDRPLRFVE